MNIEVNIVELASELASEATKREMFSKGLIVDENEMYIEEAGIGYYTEEAQEIFNDYYDTYYTIIESVKV